MEDQYYLKLNDIDCYSNSLRLSNQVWTYILTWDWFAKRTVGAQFVQAMDSISANIAEGFGRFGKKDKVKFYYYSLGSVKESLDWNEKARVRLLLSTNEYNSNFVRLSLLPKQIYQLIKYTNEKLRI